MSNKALEFIYNELKNIKDCHIDLALEKAWFINKIRNNFYVLMFDANSRYKFLAREIEIMVENDIKTHRQTGVNPKNGNVMYKFLKMLNSIEINYSLNE
jgi:hypothetical protein